MSDIHVFALGKEACAALDDTEGFMSGKGGIKEGCFFVYNDRTDTPYELADAVVGWLDVRHLDSDEADVVSLLDQKHGGLIEGRLYSLLEKRFDCDLVDNSNCDEGCYGYETLNIRDFGSRVLLAYLPIKKSRKRSCLGSDLVLTQDGQMNGLLCALSRIQFFSDVKGE